MLPTVVQAQAMENFIVRAYCADGKIRDVDIKPLINGMPMFAPLVDFKVFSETLTVMHGDIAWDLEGDRDGLKCLDIDPEIVMNAPLVRREIADPG